MAVPFSSAIRATTLAFGNLFNQIQVVRFQEDGTEAERFLVPIQYANKEKYLQRLQGDPNLDRNVQVSLPAMSFERTGLVYDTSRKQITNAKNFFSDAAGHIHSEFNPVPYNVNFNLYVYTRNEEDGLQIIERILPFFTPDYTVKIELVPSLGIVKDIPIILDQVNYDNGSEGNFTSDTRTLVWTLSFTAKSYIFGQPAQAALVKTVIVDIINFDTNIGISETIIRANTDPMVETDNTEFTMDNTEYDITMDKINDPSVTTTENL